MNTISTTRIAFLRWIDTVAGVVCSAFERLSPPSVVEVIENEDESFTLRAVRGRKGDLADHRFHIKHDLVSEVLPTGWTGRLAASRVQLFLQPGRFLVRPLELPKRAMEFLDGIIRSQIDRLTPWNANQAIYGWTAANDGAADKINMNIVAAARTTVIPMVLALQASGAKSVTVSTRVPDAQSRLVVVDVLEHRAARPTQMQRARKAVIVIFAVAAATAAVSAATSNVLGGILDTRQETLSQKIAQRRAALRIGLGAVDIALSRLEQRKHENAASVLVLEALSRLLPDDTYVTELRLQGNKVQLVGITQDAPSLIGILEQSSQFKAATFFAPTTRGANDPGERFHIEARIESDLEAGL